MLFILLRVPFGLDYHYRNNASIIKNQNTYSATFLNQMSSTSSYLDSAKHAPDPTPFDGRIDANLATMKNIAITDTAKFYRIAISLLTSLHDAEKQLRTPGDSASIAKYMVRIQNLTDSIKTCQSTQQNQSR